jgi:Family of unknown function (DUF6011)
VSVRAVDVFWCLECDNRLTDPVSIRRAYGPLCWERMWDRKRRLAAAEATPPIGRGARALAEKGRSSAPSVRAAPLPVLGQPVVLTACGQRIPLHPCRNRQGAEGFAALHRRADGSRYYAARSLRVKKLGLLLPCEATLTAPDGNGRIELWLSPEWATATRRCTRFEGVLLLDRRSYAGVVSFAESDEGWLLTARLFEQPLRRPVSRPSLW